ncbi:MAG: transporter related [Candidatus Solibacter sp.]|jgi:lipopolysaccharide transport system ATP-binding protein|nr:transporter related [Candidatus Solibacter sp.]
MIEFEHVSKTFSHTGGAKLLGAHVRERLQRREREVFYALKDVSFRVEPGHSMAIIGGNGAGKSTLLSLVAGLSRPNEGRVTVDGKVAALLELGSGFHPDLTGRENVALNASMLGLSRKRTEESFESIVEFSGIGDFIEEPIRTYSSGMIMRLAFSVAVNVNPDILIIDEVLAVGDQAFQAKCFEKIFGFKRAGKTLLFVSHSPQLVRDLCDQAVWLHHGKAMMVGTAEEVLTAYSASSV